MDVNEVIDVTDYYRNGDAERAGWLGQLDPNFQRALSYRYSTVTAEECDFYHTINDPNGTVYPGAWNLSGREEEYLGGVDLSGKRVMEFGPATGTLTAYMAQRGASVVTFDLAPGYGPEILPFPTIDPVAAKHSGIASMDRLRNSWWFARKTLDFSATAIYGDIYKLPADVGRFDVSVFGAILLHLRNPFQALQNAAEITQETMIITDVLNAPRSAGGDAFMVFNPTLPPQDMVTWWGLSPEVIQRMLLLLGFSRSSVTVHKQAMEGLAADMFTVTAWRDPPV